ncbi:MAG TPA: amidohydrolase [Thermoanaerobaculia bacterium]|nr:amidohydrolase [Thermoanaerobaculia bacterium]
MTRARITLTGALCIAAGLLLGAAGAAPPEIVLLHGKVFTADPAMPWAEAVAVKGERVLAVGKSDEIARLAGPGTRRIDLSGRVVVPGFNDAHDHVGPEPSGMKLQGPKTTLDEVLAALAAAVKTAPAGTRFFDEVGSRIFEDPRANRATLDRAAPGRFVFLVGWTAHGVLASSAALSALGVPDEPEDPAGGWFEREAGSRRASGVVQEYAQFALRRRLCEAEGTAAAARAFQEAAGQAARFGVTTIQNMLSYLSVEKAAAALAAAPVPIRIRLIRFPMTDSRGRDSREGRGLAAHPSPLVTVSGVKWILDGTPIERGAAMREPYADRTGWLGHLNFPESEIRAMLEEARKSGEQLMLHCAGDRTAEVVLKQMEASGGAAVWAGRRVRIEHGDGLMEDLFALARRLGVVVVQNPTHLTLTDVFSARLGPARAPRFLPFGSLAAAGIPLAIGSDGPMNPFLNILCAVTNPNHPNDALTVEQAVTAYTRGSAFAEFAEKEKGTLAAGMLADLAVLSQDIFTVAPPKLPETESVLTLVGGKIVYEKKTP